MTITGNFIGHTPTIVKWVEKITVVSDITDLTYTIDEEVNRVDYTYECNESYVSELERYLLLLSRRFEVGE